jgi:hypothetical protein
VKGAVSRRGDVCKRDAAPLLSFAALRSISRSLQATRPWAIPANSSTARLESCSTTWGRRWAGQVARMA